MTLLIHVSYKTVVLFMLKESIAAFMIHNYVFMLQAAYLVGIADPASQPGRPGLVDPSQFARALQAIQMACSNLTNPAASQKEVLVL